jgi:signal transduction histidine kinase
VDPVLSITIGIAVGLAAVIPLALFLTKRTERRARASERRARQAEHLADVGTLTAGLAHEIRNPLSTLNLNLQLLREDLDRPGNPADPLILRKLDSLEQESRRLQQILDDFLKFAGKQEVHLTVQPINPILEELATFYRDRLQRAGVQVRTSLAEGLPPVALDAARLKAAVANLLLNAESAMPTGGDLMIATEPERRGLHLHVTDTGHGIARDNLDKIFAPYYSTRPGGTGLGLPTVRRIVQEHAATLEVHSEIGRGTRFTIHFPGPDEGGFTEPRA